MGKKNNFCRLPMCSNKINKKHLHYTEHRSIRYRLALQNTFKIKHSNFDLFIYAVFSMWFVPDFKKVTMLNYDVKFCLRTSRTRGHVLMIAFTPKQNVHHKVCPHSWLKQTTTTQRKQKTVTTPSSAGTRLFTHVVMKHKTRDCSFDFQKQFFILL